MKRLTTSAEAKPCARQHKAPCPDCPWARRSLPGWLGPHSVQEWIEIAHGDLPMPCHSRAAPEHEQATVDVRGGTTHWQCAGLAIYRANVCKIPRSAALRLPQNKALVFSFHEFEAHHGRSLLALAEQGEEDGD